MKGWVVLVMLVVSLSARGVADLPLATKPTLILIFVTVLALQGFVNERMQRSQRPLSLSSGGIACLLSADLKSWVIVHGLLSIGQTVLGAEAG